MCCEEVSVSNGWQSAYPGWPGSRERERRWLILAAMHDISSLHLRPQKDDKGGSDLGPLGVRAHVEAGEMVCMMSKSKTDFCNALEKALPVSAAKQAHSLLDWRHLSRDFCAKVEKLLPSAGGYDVNFSKPMSSRWSNAQIGLHFGSLTLVALLFCWGSWDLKLLSKIRSEA